MRSFFIFILIAILIATLILAGSSDDGWQSFRLAAFHVVSMLTTTGFVTDNFADWPNHRALLADLGRLRWRMRRVDRRRLEGDSRAVVV